MSNTTIIYIVAAGTGAVALVVYVTLILVPAWASYTRIWQRLAASFLTLYVLAALLGLGVAGGAALIWFWDRIWG